MVISAARFAAGIAALVSGQSYAVWYGLGFPGLLRLIIFGVLIGVVSRRYQEAELRRSMAEDI